MSESKIIEEAEFGIDEMFVSCTDQKGLIQSGNAVFLRIAKYELAEMFKKPHNIIRHPDMPKCVFRLFWKYLKANKPIAAMVKNRSKDQRPYWVLATAFPAGDGYLSVRVKPSRELVSQMEGAYAAILAAEEKGGMDAGEAKLIEILKSLGFANYDEFSLTILQQQLSLRDSQVFATQPQEIFNNTSLSDRGLAHMYEYAFRSGCSFAGVAQDYFRARVEFLSKQVDSKSIYAACDRLHFLSANMSITAQKLGREGSALAVVAMNFQRSSAQVRSRLAAIESSIAQVSKMLDPLGVDIFAARLKVDVLAFQVKEVLAVEKGKEDFGLSREARLKDCMSLITHVENGFTGLTQTLSEFTKSTINAETELRSLMNIILTLDLIRTGGKLEGARTHEIEESFGPFVMEMDSFIKAVKGPLEDLINQISRLNTQLFPCVSALNETGFLVAQLVVIQKSYFEKPIQANTEKKPEVAA